MNDLLTHLVSSASQNIPLAYFIIYIGTIFVGNISAFVSFWVILHGNFGSWGIPLLILTIFLADLTGDLSWYGLGRLTRNTGFGRWIQRRAPGYEKIEEAAVKHGGVAIFLAKFVYASSFPVIFSLGWIQMPFKRFLRNSVLSILIWLPVLIGLAFGLIAGLSPLSTVSAFKDFEVIFLGGLILFAFLQYLLARVMGKIFERRSRREAVPRKQVADVTVDV